MEHALGNCKYYEFYFWILWSQKTFKKQNKVSGLCKDKT